MDNHWYTTERWLTAPRHGVSAAATVLNFRASSLKAVIFDLDGLLVDSEPLQFRAYREAFSSHGLPFTMSNWQRWHELGASASAWIASMGGRQMVEHVPADHLSTGRPRALISAAG
jgi:hypothetical protein